MHVCLNVPKKIQHHNAVRDKARPPKVQSQISGWLPFVSTSSFDID
jgi:hypothetical protein